MTNRNAARTPVRILFIEDSEVDVELAVLELERDGFEVTWDRVEVEGVLAGLQAGQPPLHQVEGARHGAEVDALARGAALDVGDVRQEGLLAELPGVPAARPGQDPAVHQAAQGGAVAGAVQVVVHRAPPGPLVQAQPQAPEDSLEFGR